MGLNARLRELRYRVAWRLRFWWLDTPGGARAHVATICVAVLALVWQIARMAVAALHPRPVHSLAGEPVHAVYWWVVQLVIAIVAAVVAYALRPKTQQQSESNPESPTVEDGSAVKDYGGTVWIDYADDFLLYYEVVGRDAIYSKGGKK